MSRVLVVATHNTHKTDEIREIAGAYFDRIVDLTDYPDIPPAEETGATFEENSEIKATAATAFFPGALILADDSGLEVDALDGAPGVHSARFAGEDADDAANRRKLLEEMAAMASGNPPRTARFRCVLTAVQGDEKRGVFSGACEGTLAMEERGENGFGYDPLFIPEGYEQTFGELASEVKHGLSHRGKALAAFGEWLEAEMAQD